MLPSPEGAPGGPTPPGPPRRTALLLLGAGVLVALAAWLRTRYQAPFIPMLTHSLVGREMLANDPRPWQTLLGRSAGMLGEGLRALVLPELLLLAAVLMAARAFTASTWRPRAGHRLLWPVLLGLAVGGPAWVAATAMGWGSFAGDEFSYLFQAHVFGSGMWTAPSPPHPEFYGCNNIVNQGRWFSIYPPGWPLLLAIGDLLGRARFVPLATGLAAVAFSSLLAGELAARRPATSGATAAACTAVLLLASPFFVFNAASVFPHVPLMAAAAAALWLHLRWQRAPESIGLPLACGLALGLAIDIRPPEGLLVSALVAGFHATSPAVRTRPGAAVLLSGLALAALPLLIANQHQTGSPWRSGYDIDYQRSLFDVKGSGQSPAAALWNLQVSLWRVLAWQAPLQASLLACWVSARRSRPVQEWLVVGYAVTTVAAYMFYFNLGQVEYGARYYACAWGICTALAGLALADLVGRSWSPRAVLMSGLLLVVFCAVAQWPALLREVGRSCLPNAQLDRWLKDAAPAGSAVFVRTTPDGYAAWYNRNAWDFSGGPRRLIFLDPEANRRIRRALAGPAFVLDFSPELGNFRLLPFDERPPDAVDDIVAGINYANSLGDRESAWRCWSRVGPDSPYRWSARFNMLRAAAAQGRDAEVIDLAGELEARGGTPGPVLYLHGRSALALGRTDEARALLRRSLESLAPESADATRARHLLESI